MSKSDVDRCTQAPSRLLPTTLKAVSHSLPTPSLLFPHIVANLQPHLTVSVYIPLLLHQTEADCTGCLFPLRLASPSPI